MLAESPGLFIQITFFALVLALLVALLIILFRLLNSANDLRDPDLALKKAEQRVKQPRRPWRKHLDDDKRWPQAVKQYQERLRDSVLARRQIRAEELGRLWLTALAILAIGLVGVPAVLGLLRAGWGYVLPGVEGFGFPQGASPTFVSKTIAAFVYYCLEGIYALRLAPDLDLRIGGVATIDFRDLSDFGLKTIYGFFVIYTLGSALEFLRRGFFLGIRPLLRAVEGAIDEDEEIHRRAEMDPEELVKILRREYSADGGLLGRWRSLWPDNLRAVFAIDKA